jgi:hypothetical protein
MREFSNVAWRRRDKFPGREYISAHSEIPKFPSPTGKAFFCLFWRHPALEHSQQMERVGIPGFFVAYIHGRLGFTLIAVSLYG